MGSHIDSKSTAIAEAERIRTAIRNGTFRPAPQVAPPPAPVMTFQDFAEVWKEGRGRQLVRARDNDYRPGRITPFVLPGRGGRAFGDMALDQIRTGDIEAFRDARKAAGCRPARSIMI